LSVVLFLRFYVMDDIRRVGRVKTEYGVIVLPAEEFAVGQGLPRKGRGNAFNLLHEIGGRDGCGHSHREMHMIGHAANGKNGDMETVRLANDGTVDRTYPIGGQKGSAPPGSPHKMQSDFDFAAPPRGIHAGSITRGGAAVKGLARQSRKIAPGV
jgi:hypothetical protein